MSILRNKPKPHIAASQPAHLINVTSSSGDLTSGPIVGLEIRLPERGVLALDMRRDEAYDLPMSCLRQ